MTPTTLTPVATKALLIAALSDRERTCRTQAKSRALSGRHLGDQRAILREEANRCMRLATDVLRADAQALSAVLSGVGTPHSEYTHSDRGERQGSAER